MSELDDVKRIGAQPAYPVFGGVGMTLRQYAAIAALQGLIANEHALNKVALVAKDSGRAIDVGTYDVMAAIAIGQADALLTQLAKS